MNGYADDEGIEGLTELIEDMESDESDESNGESDEARPRRFRPVRPKVPSGRGLFRPRPTANHVTQTQLQAALARVGGQIKTNADATKAVGTRVNAVATRVDQEIVARKKDTTAIKKDVANASQMGLLPMLLQRPPELDVKKEDPNNPLTVTSVTVKKSSDNLLPLMMMMGMGGMGGMGGEGKGGDNNMMMMVLLLLMMK